jgi:hypothetical protein
MYVSGCSHLTESRQIDVVAAWFEAGSMISLLKHKSATGGAILCLYLTDVV